HSRIYSNILRSPPSSTPFPYTTLFRSQPVRQSLRQRHRIGLYAELLEGEERAGPADPRLHLVEHQQCAALDEVQTGVGRTGSFLDRKSTRLNSSHVSNSYAVFCLKKKK